MSERKPVTFESAHKDEWGNLHVLCPACELPFKHDGVVNHIVKMAKSGEKMHSLWLKGYVHGWQDVCSRMEVSIGKVGTLSPKLPEDIHTLKT